MTFSRHYAKIRKAQLKQQSQGAPPRQAQRWSESETAELPKKPVVRRALYRSLILVLVLVLALVAVFWYERVAWFFPIRHINVEGQTARIDTQALQHILSGATGRSMFSSLDPLQQQLLHLPWVQTVQLTRAWPSSLVVHFTEVEPVARFNEDWVLTRSGSLLAPPDKTLLMQLPWLSGPPDKALYLWQVSQVMNAVLAPLGLRIARLNLSPRFSYEITLNNGLGLYLGANQVMERLQLFVKVYSQQLAAKVDKITAIDLRYPSSMAIVWKVPALPVVPEATIQNSAKGVSVGQA